MACARCTRRAPTVLRSGSIGIQGFLLLLFPAIAHQGSGALGARGHRLLRVSNHIRTRHLALLGGLVRTCQRGADIVRVHHVLGMTAKGLEDFIVPYLWGVGCDTLLVSLW